MDSPLAGIELGPPHVVRLWSFAYCLSVVKEAKPYIRLFEERLGHTPRADQHPEGLQRHLSRDPETIGVPSGGSSRQAIPMGAAGVVELNSQRQRAISKTKSWKV